MNKEKIINSLVAGIFSTLTIGCLTLLTYKTQFGLFLIASFGSTMLLLYGYPESPFAQPKNIFFGHILTAFIGVIFVNYIPLPLYLSIPISVGLGVFSMIFFNVTHPPAGGNPIIVLMGSASFGYLLYPVIIGVLIVILFGIILNRFILKKTYPKT